MLYPLARSRGGSGSGTADCDVVLPAGRGVQGEHLKLGYHELKVGAKGAK